MTEEEQYAKLEAKLDKILEKLSEKLEDVGKTLQNHEVRIVVLERAPAPSPAARPADAKDWKAEAISMLIKALIIGGSLLATLFGVKNI